MLIMKGLCLFLNSSLWYLAKESFLRPYNYSNQCKWLNPTDGPIYRPTFKLLYAASYVLTKGQIVSQKTTKRKQEGNDLKEKANTKNHH
jgi:hypothetical protein